ncbi:Rha family transcriptional regulator [Paucibacter sp. AS339]|uniref:Rha family transcriptional regulator n=1 Tax=Paucibacter hankyongi TaxID=3133434 RepID=UPI0030AA523A
MAAKTNALAGGAAQGIEQEQVFAVAGECSSASAEGKAFELVDCQTERRADTRLLARHLGIGHRPVMALIDRYAEKFKAAGKLLFKKAPSAKGQAVRFALLNEDQANFLLSLSRNSERTVSLKLKLTQAFGEYRRAAEMRRAEYLPGYHAAHKTIQDLAAGSENERFVHMNFNRLVNKVAGIDAGQRSSAPVPQQALLIVAQSMAAQAMQGAADHKDGYSRAKRVLEPLAALMQAQVTPQLTGPQKGSDG